LSIAVVTSHTAVWRNLTACRKGLWRFWLHHHDCHCSLTQTCNNCAETHIGSGVQSPFSSHGLPLLIDRSCDVTYVAIRMLGHNNGAAKSMW